MVDGLWTVEFSSTIGLRGTGVFVLMNQKVLGGDHGYYYKGTYALSDGRITGDLAVIRYNRNAVSVFGDLGHFSLSFNGSIDENSIDAVAVLAGAMPDMGIHLVCRKKEEF